MLLSLSFAFIGGTLTILAPCTLPVVPFVFGATANGGRGRVGGVFVGFAATFVLVTVVLAALLATVGVTTGGLRIGSAIVLGIAGAALAIPILANWFEMAAAPLARLGSRLVPFGATAGWGGFLGGFGLGAASGLVWAPCVGPIMAAVIAVALASGPTIATTAVAMAYVAGACVPLLAIATLGRRSASAAGWARRLKPGRVVGTLMVVAALLVVSGFDVGLENGVASVLPSGWGTALLSVEPTSAVQQEAIVTTTPNSGSPGGALGTSPGHLITLPPPLDGNLPGQVSLDDLGPAPDFTGITAWLNSGPLTIGALHGKVVLVEFWTFACINCIHVQPYVKAWSERYSASGLVVVGVHSPELSFERDLGNVRDAVATAGLAYPIAFDPAFATWNAYHNAYWPALYFVDRSGRIRHLHVGEGDYNGSEQVIRQLLAEAL